MKYIYYDYRLENQDSEQFTTTDFKTYYKVRGIKTAWDLNENRLICDKTEYKAKSYSNILMESWFSKTKHQTIK